jgi:V8-like Glu-specific endopeptidase
MKRMQNHLRWQSYFSSILHFFLLLLFAAAKITYGQQQTIISRRVPTLTPQRSSTYVSNAYPFRAVTKLFSTFPDDEVYEGTGVFVSRDVVFTAAHVVYDSKHGGRATRVLISPGYSGGDGWVGHTRDRYIRVPDEYLKCEDENYDFAVILTADALGDRCGFLGFDAPPGPNVGAIRIIGYSSLFDGAETMVESVSDAVLANSNEIQHIGDTTKGMSGAPIIIPNPRAPGAWLVIGVHTRGGRGLPFNFGVRFSRAFVRNLPGYERR